MDWLLFHFLFIYLKRKTFLYFKDKNDKRSLGFMSGDVEPWSIRGGLAGEFLVCLIIYFIKEIYFLFKNRIFFH